MSYEIALVNPRSKSSVKKKRRAKRKMSALQRKYFGPRASRVKRKKQRRRAAPHPGVQQVAKRRRKRRAKSTAVAVRRSNPRRVARSHRHWGAVRKHKRRTNPRLLSGTVGDIVGTLIPAGIGAAGVMAVDRVIGFLPLANLSADPAMQKHINRAARLLATAGVGFAAIKVLGKSQGSAVATAAMGIAIHGVLSSFFGTGVGLSGDLDGDDMGAYMEGDDMGAMDPAPLLAGEMDGDDMGAYLQGDLDGDDVGAYLNGSDD